MSIDLSKCHMSPAGSVITAQGRMSYAQFLTEQQERQNDDGSISKFYSMSLLCPPGSDFTLLKNEMGKVALKHLDNDQKRAKQFVEKRFLDPNNLPQGGKPAGPEFEGWTLLRATSKYMPKFVYPNGKEISTTEEAIKEIYSGRWARATLNAYWTDNKKNPGVCVGLQHIQLLGHDDNMGVALPDAASEFGSAEGDTTANDDAGDSDVDAMFG
jgi:hypothetical protein